MPADVPTILVVRDAIMPATRPGPAWVCSACDQVRDRPLAGVSERWPGICFVAAAHVVPPRRAVHPVRGSATARPRAVTPGAVSVPNIHDIAVLLLEQDVISCAAGVARLLGMQRLHSLDTKPMWSLRAFRLDRSVSTSATRPTHIGPYLRPITDGVGLLLRGA